MFKGSFAVIVILVLSSIFVYADAGFDDTGNPNDPDDNDRANACYEGGSMEGKCDEEIEWSAGWYLIRYEYGLLAREDVPSWVVWVIPPEVVPEELAEIAVVSGATPSTGARAGCHTDGSFSFIWPGGDGPASVNYWFNTTCAGAPRLQPRGTFVYAANIAEARTRCIGGGFRRTNNVDRFTEFFLCS